MLTETRKLWGVSLQALQSGTISYFVVGAKDEDFSPLMYNLSYAVAKGSGIRNKLVLQIENGHFGYIASANG